VVNDLLADLLPRLGIPDERVEGIWRQVMDVFRGGILADWLRTFYNQILSGDINECHFFL
jgi:hypothetical protein